MVATQDSSRFITASATVVLCGVVLSGPVAVGLVELLAPQPIWQDASTFISHYSWIQNLPYLFGFLILGGFIALMSGLARSASDERRPSAFTSLAFTIVSASIIFLNYVLQTAFVPLSLQENPGYLSIITMANPNSIGWELEMYGYGILGIATTFAASLFDTGNRQRWIRRLFILNGIISILGAVLVPLIPGWVLTPAGMTAGGIWNALIVTAMILLIREFTFKGETQAIGASRTSL